MLPKLVLILILIIPIVSGFESLTTKTFYETGLVFDSNHTLVTFPIPNLIPYGFPNGDVTLNFANLILEWSGASCLEIHSNVRTLGNEEQIVSESTDGADDQVICGSGTNGGTNVTQTYFVPPCAYEDIIFHQGSTLELAISVTEFQINPPTEQVNDEWSLRMNVGLEASQVGIFSNQVYNSHVERSLVRVAFYSLILDSIGKKLDWDEVELTVSECITLQHQLPTLALDNDPHNTTNTQIPFTIAYMDVDNCPNPFDNQYTAANFSIDQTTYLNEEGYPEWQWKLPVDLSGDTQHHVVFWLEIRSTPLADLFFSECKITAQANVKSNDYNEHDPKGVSTTLVILLGIFSGFFIVLIVLIIGRHYERREPIL